MGKNIIQIAARGSLSTASNPIGDLGQNRQETTPTLSAHLKAC